MPLEHQIVFVYGTLKKGFHNHAMMRRAGGEFVCRGRTQERYPLVIDGLPYLLPTAGSGYEVEGELYRVPDAEGWGVLDRLEGHPKFYKRRVETIIGDDGEQYAAWVYFLASGAGDLSALPPVRAYAAR